MWVRAVTEHADVVVVGTGVVGLAVAAGLLDRRLAVAVIGQRTGEHRGQATRAAGAMLSTFSEIEPHHPPNRVQVETAERVAATELYPQWLDGINSCAGTDVRAVPGTWVLAAPGQVGHLRPVAAAARAAGYVAEQHEPSTIPAFAPPSACEAALWLPAEARIDTSALMNALTAAVTASPRCRWLDTTAIAAEQGRVRCADGEDVRAGDVVLAAGTGIPGLLGGNGAALGVPPILAGRGVAVLLRAQGVTPPHVVRTPNAAFACGVHLVPRDDGTLYLGGTNRLTISPDPNRHPTLDELALLAGDAARLLTPALRAAELLGSRVGLRPYTLDHLPLLGRTRDRSLLLATATYRCGVMLAPRIATLIADEITTPGALAEHPYRVMRPMPPPDIAPILNHGTAELLQHLLQGGGHLPPSAATEFTAFTALALRALTDEHSHLGAPLRRLWATAPVAEALPSLFALAQRLEDSQP
jgi:glycine oxidase